MHLDTYTDRLREEVAAALALLGDSETQDLGRRLLLALDPAVRLVLLESLSDAAAEISTTLPGASVEARLRGRDVEFTADVADPGADAAPVGMESPEEPVAEEATGPQDLTRITLRLPEHLKARAEEQATAQGVSLNSWLVDAVRRAAVPAPPGPPPPPYPTHGARSTARRLTGWA